MIPMESGLGEHLCPQQTQEQWQLKVILQQQQYILKQQQQITVYHQQQRFFELEKQFQELVWEQQQILQEPLQIFQQDPTRLLQQQELMHQQQQIIYQQQSQLQILQQQQQWQLSQPQLLAPQRNRHRRSNGYYNTPWYIDKYRSQLAQTITPSTIINGKSLMNIVNEHCSLVYFIENIYKEFTGSQVVHNAGDLFEQLRTIISIAGERNFTQDRQYNPAANPEVIIDCGKESTIQPETLTATFQDNSYLSHEDIVNYARYYKIPKNEMP